MRDFKKILFPVDLSDITPKIVPYVISTADKYNSEVHILFALHRLDQFSRLTSYLTMPDLEKELVENAEKKMGEFVQQYFRGRPGLKTKIVKGDHPAEEILRYVKSENIDLVIMGTHGRKGISRVLVGSIAERVFKLSPVPVLSVNPFEE
jgi:nucleotide-binding universal stress UspA family protein